LRQCRIPVKHLSHISLTQSFLSISSSTGKSLSPSRK
jgi:hypothetical protein